MLFLAGRQRQGWSRACPAALKIVYPLYETGRTKISFKRGHLALLLSFNALSLWTPAIIYKVCGPKLFSHLVYCGVPHNHITCACTACLLSELQFFPLWYDMIQTAFVAKT